LSRLSAYKQASFTAIPPNATGEGWGRIELAKLLHDEFFGEYWRRLGRGTVVPVGGGAVSVQQSSDGVPRVVPRAPGNEQTSIPPPIDRRDVPSNEETLQRAKVYWSNVGGRWTLTHPAVGRLDGLTEAGMNQMSAELGIPTARQEAANTITPGTGTVGPITLPGPVATKPPEEQPMDLGQLLNTGLDVYGRYLQTQQLQTTPVVNSPFVPDFIEQYVPGFTEDGSPVLIPGQKKCKPRRRRRRLATKSDLGDLAALKAILGNGEAFKAWIATHSR